MICIIPVIPAIDDRGRAFGEGICSQFVEFFAEKIR
jgi:hypothetical protein